MFPKLCDFKIEKDELLAKAQAILDAAGDEITAEQKREFDEVLHKVRQLDLKIMKAESGEDISESQQRWGEQFTGNEVRVIRPGELRFLRNTERLAQVYPPDKKMERFDLGKYIGLAVGESPADSEVERRALSGSSDTAGGFLVPEPVSRDIWDMARNKAAVMRAGAVTFVMPSESILIPQLTADPTGSWKSENAEGSEDSVTVAAVRLIARTMFFWLPISRELWQDAGNLDSTLRNILSQVAAIKLDYAALMGISAAQEPGGLYSDSDIVKTAAAEASAYDDLSDSIFRIQDANLEPNGIVMSPRSANYIRKMKDGEGIYLPRPDWLPPVYVTKQIPDTLGDSADESIAITGAWSNLIIGIRMPFRLEVLKEVKAQKFQIVIMGAMRANCIAVRSAAFDILSEIKTAWIA